MAPEFEEGALERLIQDFIRHATGDDAGLADRVSSLEQRRFERVDSDRQRLVELLGEDDPGVKLLTERAERHRGVAESMGRGAQLLRALGGVARPHEWIANGQVRDEEGKPLKGVRVRIFDKDRKYDDLLATETTGDLGEFRAVYHDRDFHEPGEEMPELFVRVEDAEGRLLFASKAPVRPAGGRTQFFDLVIEGAVENRCKAVTKSGLRCKRQATEGTKFCGVHK